MANETTRGDSAPAKTLEPRLLVMSAIGRLGRFGNQIFQYAFLRIAARASGAEVQCHPWIGQALFGQKEPPVTAALTPLFETGSNLSAMLGHAPEFQPYVEKATGKKGRKVGVEAMREGVEPGDLIGLFQWHTSAYAPHKEYFRSLFQPREDLLPWLEEPLTILRKRGRTIVAIHLRIGDYRWLPQYSFTLMPSPEWWVEWLDSIWGTLDNPVLFVCSNNVAAVRHVFSRYNPVTYPDCKLEPPERLRGKNADFYRDYYVMTQADVLGISNSSFSFSAAMLNERAKLFVRPHWDFATRFTTFDPWNSDPLLFMKGTERTLTKSYGQMLRTARDQHGIKGAIATAVLHYPVGIAIITALRVNIAWKGFGVRGVFNFFTRRPIGA